MRSTRIAAALAGTALMAGLAACGPTSDKGGSAAGGGDKAGAGQASGGVQAELAKAAKSTSGRSSAKVQGSQTVGTPKGTMSNSIDGTMDWSGGSLVGDLKITSKGGAAAALGAASGKPMEAKYTKDAMYMDLGSLAAAAGKGKHWVKYGYDALAKQGPSGALLKDQLQNHNPARSVELLLASGQVQKAGQATVNGKPATHYTGTVDVSKLAQMQSKNLSKSQLSQLSAQLKQQGYTQEHVDLWIDGDNLLVKKREQAQSKTGKLDSTITYSDYGTKVSVTPPPASQTMDISKMMKPGGSSSLPTG